MARGIEEFPTNGGISSLRGDLSLVRQLAEYFPVPIGTIYAHTKNVKDFHEAYNSLLETYPECKATPPKIEDFIDSQYLDAPVMHRKKLKSQGGIVSEKKIRNRETQEYDREYTIEFFKEPETKRGNKKTNPKPVLHRIGGPSVIVTDMQGVVKSLKWYKDGKLHRHDGPAELTYNAEKSLIKVGWYKNGLFHNEMGPANISLWGNGVIEQLNYSIDDELTRSDGPAYNRYNWTGHLLAEGFYDKGSPKGLNGGPTEIGYDNAGRIKQKLWHKQTSSSFSQALHNENGPAEINYKDGVLSQEKWFIDGETPAPKDDVAFEKHYDDQGKLKTLYFQESNTGRKYSMDADDYELGKMQAYYEIQREKIDERLTVLEELLEDRGLDIELPKEPTSDDADKIAEYLDEIEDLIDSINARYSQ